MPVGRWGHGGHVFRWSNLCRLSSEKASAVHVWAGNQGEQPWEKKLMRRGLLSMPARGFSLWLKAASRQVLIWTKMQPGHLRLPNESPVEWWEQAEFQKRCSNTASTQQRVPSYLYGRKCSRQRWSHSDWTAGNCVPVCHECKPSWSNSAAVTDHLTHLCLWMLVCAAGRPVSRRARQSWNMIALGWQPRCHGNAEKCQVLVRSNDRLVFGWTGNIYNKEGSDEGRRQA